MTSLSLEKLALEYDIDILTAQHCIKQALSRILNKEVISIDNGYAYFSENRVVFIKIRFTHSIRAKIAYYFEKEVNSFKNKKFKEVFYKSREEKIFPCKIIFHHTKWFEVVGVTNAIKGRLYFDQIISGESYKVKDVVLLKLKSFIKLDGLCYGVFTRKDTYIYINIVYIYVNKDLIEKLKIDFDQKKLIIKFYDQSLSYTREIRQSVFKLSKEVPFKILTK